MLSVSKEISSQEYENVRLIEIKSETTTFSLILSPKFTEAILTKRGIVKANFNSKISSQTKFKNNEHSLKKFRNNLNLKLLKWV